MINELSGTAGEKPFTFAKDQIPACLPLYRGIHICSDNFMKAFRYAYGQDSTILAKCCQDATSNPDYTVSNDPNYNPLFNSSMF